MELDKQIRLGHLLLNDRQCRVCGEYKNLIDGFYRVVTGRITSAIFDKWEYPDW